MVEALTDIGDWYTLVRPAVTAQGRFYYSIPLTDQQMDSLERALKDRPELNTGDWYGEVLSVLMVARCAHDFSLVYGESIICKQCYVPRGRY